MLGLCLCILLGCGELLADQERPVEANLLIDSRELDGSYKLSRIAEYQKSARETQVPDEHAWERHSADLINLGFSKDAHWIRIRFQVTEEPHHGDAWLFELGTANARIVDLSHRFNGKELAVHRTGSGVPFGARAVRYRKLTYPVQMLPGQHELLLRIESHSSVSLEPVLSSRSHWLAHVLTDELVAGAWLGLIAILVLYNVVVFIRVRDPVFGYFGSALTGSLSWLMAESGVSPHHIYPDNPGIHDFVLRFSLGAMLAGLSFFS